VARTLKVHEEMIYTALSTSRDYWSRLIKMDRIFFQFRVGRIQAKQMKEFQNIF
jgi:hypothetical protein